MKGMKIITFLVASSMLLSGVLAAEELSGVGLALVQQSQGDRPQVKAVLPRSPAASAGIEPGAILLAINGTNTAGMSIKECTTLIRGPEGTKVTLEMAGPKGTITNAYTLVRKKIAVSRGDFRIGK